MGRDDREGAHVTAFALTVGELTLERERKVTPGDGKEEVATVDRETKDGGVRCGSRLAWGSAPVGPSGLAVLQLLPVPGNCFISVDDEVLINLIDTFQQPVLLLL